MNRAATVALAPLSSLYGAAVKTRLALHKAGALHAQHIGAPVISVGNITTGGTGKTPLVEWIARDLARRDRRVCVLTRGYGRANSRPRVLVSNRESILANVREAGDEPLLLAENLVGCAAVISDADRASAARWAVDHLGSNAFILDDGFQNLRVARDLDIVTIDAMNPWSNGRLLPAGRLREPRSGLSRADCIIVTRADQSDSIGALQQQIDRFSGERILLFSRMKTRRLRHLGGDSDDRIGSKELKTAPVAAFCAIGNPDSFFSHLRRHDYPLSYTCVFGDHHAYTQSEVDAIARTARARGAQALLTTAKDGVKLRRLQLDLPCYVVEIEIEIEGEERLRQLISGAISSRTKS